MRVTVELYKYLLQREKNSALALRNAMLAGIFFRKFPPGQACPLPPPLLAARALPCAHEFPCVLCSQNFPSCGLHAPSRSGGQDWLSPTRFSSGRKDEGPIRSLAHRPPPLPAPAMAFKRKESSLTDDVPSPPAPLVVPHLVSYYNCMHFQPRVFSIVIITLSVFIALPPMS